MDRAQLIESLAQIKNELIKVEKTTDSRFYLVCESQNACKIGNFIFETLGCRFVIATAIDSEQYYEVLYHFSHDQTGTVLTVKALIRDRENPSVESLGPD